ncbi:hypothetical protein pb186bvf_000676 [Paramecium bursaria]
MYIVKHLQNNIWLCNKRTSQPWNFQMKRNERDENNIINNIIQPNKNQFQVICEKFSLEEFQDFKRRNQNKKHEKHQKHEKHEKHENKKDKKEEE